MCKSGEIEFLLFRRHGRSFLHAALLITEHRCGKLPSGTRRIAPRRGNGDDAVGPCDWIDVKESVMATDKTSRFFGLCAANFDEAAIGRHLVRIEHSSRSYEIEFV